MSTTPNMNLTLPTVSQTPGPSWANQINSNLTVIDSHNHLPGNGASIPSAALNINADVGFGTYSAVGLGSTQYVNQLAPTAACAVYAFGGELYYNDSSAVPIQITSNGAVVGAPGQWTNLAAPAVAAYGAGTGTFSFQSDALTFGTLQAASLKLQANTSSYPIGIAVSSGTAPYVLTLPVLAPAQIGSLLASSSTGSMSWVTAGTCISITSSSISVTNGSIGSNQLAPSSVITAAIAPQAVTQAKMELKSPTTSGLITFTITATTAWTFVTNSSLSINAVAGRPVFVWLQTEPNGSAGNVNSVNDPSGNDIRVRVLDVVGSSTQFLAHTTLGVDSGYSPSVISFTFVPANTGAYDISLYGKNNTGLMTSQLAITNVRLNAFQL